MEKKTIIVNVETADGVKALDRLEASFEDVYGEIQPLTGKLGELEDQLYQMAAAGEQGTKEFTQLATQIGKMKKVIIDVDMQVDSLSTNTGQKLGGAIQGLAGGFELAQGAMGAFGVESAKVEEALLRVNSAMAIAQGVQSVRESIPAFKALNSVIMANPIVALTAAFVALGVAAVYWASQASTKVIDAFKKSSQASQDYRNDLKETSEVQNKLGERALKALDQEAARRIAMGENSTKVQKEINAAKIKELEIAVEQDKAAVRALNAQKEKLKATQAETKEKLMQQMLDAKKAMADLSQALYINKNMTAFSEAAKQIKEIDEATAKGIQDTNAQLTTRNAELEASKDAIIALKTEQISLNNETRKGFEEAQKARNEELARIAEINAGKEALEGTYLATRRATTIENNTIDLEILKKQTDEEAAVKKAARDKEAEAEKAQRTRNIEFAIDSTIQGLSAVQSLADAFAGKSEASQRKAFKIRKAAAIAQTTIETFKAAQGAFASQIIPGDPTSPIRGAIAAGLAVASGLARVKTISSQKFEGGGSSSASGGGGSIPQPSASSPANFNIVGNSNTNQLVEGLTNNPVQAYVVSGAVTTAQSLDRNQIKTATL